MMPELNVQAMLVRAEARAKKNLELARSAKYEQDPERMQTLEDAVATAHAVRMHWEALERSASPINRSTSKTALFDEEKPESD